VRKKAIRLALSALLLALSFPANAQQPAKIARIAYLSNASSPGRLEAFRQGLRELGYVEGKNIVIEWRSGSNDRLPALVAELVGLKVDIIVSAAGGVTPSLAPELSGKRLEILNEVVPKLSRVAVFASSSFRQATAPVLKEIELAAQAFKLKIQHFDVLGLKDFETAFREASKSRADAVFMEVAGPVYIPNRKQIPELAVKSRLPVMYRRRQDVEAGGLMTYGVNVYDLDRRAATYVDKILKGAKPADLPVEQPTKFELVINLKAAKQIGLTIPQSVLYRADKVIK